MSTYIAAWNQADNLPEVEPVEFGTLTDAVEYLRDTVDRWLDEDWDEPNPDRFTADEIVSDQGFGEYTDYNLWVVKN